MEQQPVLTAKRNHDFSCNYNKKGSPKVALPNRADTTTESEKILNQSVTPWVFSTRVKKCVKTVSTELSHTKKKPRQHLTEREPHFCWSHFKGIHAFQFECAALNVCPFNKASSVLWKFSRQLPFSTALNIGRKALLCSIVLTILLIIVPGSCVISYWFFPSVSPWDN